MPDSQKLPALLRLFDDPSETVRTVVLGELSAWGGDLEDAVRALEQAPPPETIVALLAAVAEHERVAANPPGAEATGTALADDEQQDRFSEGQLVHHRRYGYRGVIVACDDRCRAPDKWYRANRTQPGREQPWYHVLVHDSTTVTYAAHSSLSPENSGEPIQHPLLGMFFGPLDAGRYPRNDRPWPPRSA